MKKIFIVIAIVVTAAVAWYLISPAFIVEEANEASPLAISRTEPKVNDAFAAMDNLTRGAFNDAVEEMKDMIVETSEPMPTQEPRLVTQGVFKPRAHEVEGKALLIEHDNERTIRFEDFETINGPNLRIYLSSDLGDDDFIDLGEIRATKGNVNYTVPKDVDLAKYNKVLVWCVPFKVLFSYAELN